MYLKRRKDDTDFLAAVVLLEQALEVLPDDEERANVRACVCSGVKRGEQAGWCVRL